MSNDLKYQSKKFICPHCNVLAQQEWIKGDDVADKFIYLNNHIFLDYRNNIKDYQQTSIKLFLEHSSEIIKNSINYIFPSNFAISECQSCNNFALWVDKQIVYPKNISVEAPNSDMNQDIQDLYKEASSILFDSPKGSAALLRLALQKLLIQLGEKGKDINCDIANLVAKGLSPKVQKALDLVRVIGNESVHPGTINLDDNRDIALRLFRLLNFIADETITKPKEIDDLFEDIIPENKKNAIEKRDNK